MSLRFKVSGWDLQNMRLQSLQAVAPDIYTFTYIFIYFHTHVKIGHNKDIRTHSKRIHACMYVWIVM